MEGETGEKGAIGFKGTEGRSGDPGLIGVKVCALFCFEITDHFPIGFQVYHTHIAIVFAFLSEKNKANVGLLKKKKFTTKSDWVGLLVFRFLTHFRYVLGTLG